MGYSGLLFLCYLVFQEGNELGTGTRFWWTSFGEFSWHTSIMADLMMTVKSACFLKCHPSQDVDDSTWASGLLVSI